MGGGGGGASTSLRSTKLLFTFCVFCEHHLSKYLRVIFYYLRGPSLEITLYKTWVFEQNLLYFFSESSMLVFKTRSRIQI